MVTHREASPVRSGHEPSRRDQLLLVWAIVATLYGVALACAPTRRFARRASVVCAVLATHVLWRSARRCAAVGVRPATVARADDVLGKMHVGVDLYPPYTWYWPDNMPVRSVGDYVPPAGRIAGRHYDEFGRLMFPDSHYQQHP